MKALSILALVALVCGGCAGLTASSSMSSLIDTQGAAATTLLPQAQAGTLSVADSTSAIVSIGDTASALHTQLTDTAWGAWTHGLWTSDANYYGPLCQTLADMTAARDLAIGRWTTTPPSQAYLNQAAAQSLRALLVVQGMKDDKTTTTVSMKKPVAKLKASAKDSLLDIIATKMPAGWISTWNSLPKATQVLIESDLSTVATWAESQIQVWWADVTAGDQTSAKELVRSNMTDADFLTAYTTDNSTGVSAIATHTANETAALKAAENLVVAIIPTILLIFGL